MEKKLALKWKVLFQMINFDCGCVLEGTIDFYKINLECPATWKLFHEGATKGVFQLESQLGKEWSKRLKPNSIEDLAALVRLIRPGCLRAVSGNPPKSMTQRYVDRKAGLESVEYFHESLEPILNKTYGVLVYQEQAMQIAQSLAGFSLQEADVLRKAIGKKKADVMAKVEGQFLKGCDSKGLVSKEEAKEIFGWIRESQRYSFNKSHAVSYAKNAYWSAYCKAHFPVEFFCSYLIGSAWKQNSHEEIYELVSDAKISEIEVRTPNIKHQKKTFYIKDNHIYFGLSDIKGVGTSAVEKIIENFSSVDNLENLDWMTFLIHHSKKINSMANQAMICSGAMGCFGVSRNRMLYEIEIWGKLTDKEREWIQGEKWDTLQNALGACAFPKKQGGGCSNYKRVDVLNDLIKVLDNPPHSLDDSAGQIAWNEKKHLGISITCNKVDACEKSVESNTTCKEFLDGKSGYIVMGVEIVRSNEITTKNGKNPGSKMAFMSISDGSCVVESVVCFPEEWSEYQGLLQEGNTVLIQGERDKKRNGLVVKEVTQI